MTQWIATLLALVALGGHATLPWQRARTDRPRHNAQDPGNDLPGTAARRWALLALPLLLTAAVAVIWTVSERPDTVSAVAAAAESWPGIALRAAVLLVASLAVADLLLLLARDRLERSGWWLIGGLGTALLLAGSLALEVIRAAASPPFDLAPILVAAGCRGGLALAAGDLLADHRPRWAPLAALALAGYWLALPTAVRDLLIADGMLLTSGAALVLLAVARWLPERLRRPGLVAAIILVALGIGRAMELSQAVPLEPFVESES